MAPEVKEVITQLIQEDVANPSSIHAYGQTVRNQITKARRSIAEFLGVRPSEIVFTSGGTEALNLALFGLIESQGPGHIITSNVEHSCVASICEHLEKKGSEVTFLPAGEYGAVNKEQVLEAIRPNTKLITLMAANNETGVKTDIDAIAHLAEEHSIPFVVDGVCLLGKERFTIPDGVTAMAFSGHKFHAPKGIGFLVLRKSLPPHIIGGGQEADRRGGTENVIGIIGLAKAVELLGQTNNRTQELRDRLEKGLIDALSHVVVNGKGPRIPNTTNLSFPGIDGDSLLMNLDLQGIAVSHGSACSSGALEPSRILLNMGVQKEVANTSIRISLSRYTTEEEVNYSLEQIIRIVKMMNG